MATAKKGGLMGGRRVAATNVEPVWVGKRQAWRVTHDGKQETVVTSASSAVAIREATVIYEGALKRLAER